eukprot:3448057-Alexandrium_andersonii.AAC.1
MAAISEADRKTYTTLTYDGKAAFRKTWADSELKKLKEEFQKSAEWDIEDIEAGEYLPLPVIVQREGGFELSQNIAAALKYAERCTCMGS